jgi:uncharacterized protein
MRAEAYPLLLIAGFAAGFINTLAGGGSHLTLPALIFLGFDASTANGTNRIAVLWQTIVGALGFARHGHGPGRVALTLAPVTIAGAYAGARLAVEVSPPVLKAIIAAVLVLTLPAIAARERREKARPHVHPVRLTFGHHAVFFAIGIYAGFIQAGVGFLILGAAVPLLGLDLVQANALKMTLVLVHTLVALPVFIAHRQVDLPAGLILALGSTVGAWIGARAAVVRGVPFVRWVLLAAVLLSALVLLGLPDWIAEWFDG